MGLEWVTELTTERFKCADLFFKCENIKSLELQVWPKSVSSQGILKYYYSPESIQIRAFFSVKYTAIKTSLIRNTTDLFFIKFL